MMGPLRILYLHYLPSGSAGLNHVSALSAALARDGADVRIGALHPMRTPIPGGDNPSVVPPKTKGAGRTPLHRLLREPRELLRNTHYHQQETELIMMLQQALLISLLGNKQQI